MVSAVALQAPGWGWDPLGVKKWVWEGQNFFLTKNFRDFFRPKICQKKVGKIIFGPILDHFSTIFRPKGPILGLFWVLFGPKRA